MCIAMADHLADLFNLGPVERASQYRVYAEIMRSRAANARTEETRLGYLRMAVDWLDMADSLDAQYGKLSVAADAPDQGRASRASFYLAPALLLAR
jgi:hypothetical protein